MAFHVNDNGDPGNCRAEKGGCPFGGEDEHYGSRVEAREAYESSQGQGALLSATRQKYSWTEGEVAVEALPENMRVRKDLIVVPKGRYFVGDPCYSAGQDNASWQKWCDKADEGDPEGNMLAATYNGYPVIGVHTAHGDGDYSDQEGNEYGVDSGMIGVVPAELISKAGWNEKSLSAMGDWVDFDNDVQITHNKGVISIGHISINTDPDNELEEEIDPDDVDGPYGEEWDYSVRY